MTVSLHPSIDGGIQPAMEGFAGGTLKCRCATDAVEVKVNSQVLHNHACGCTKCWKPAGAAFSVVGVVPREALSVTAHGDKLKVVDEQATIQRHACSVCGTHLFGRIENKAHPFYGLDFIHTELSADAGWAPPGFAAFVSSCIEGGTPAHEMDGIRKTLKARGLEPYDCLNPPLMDTLASHAAKTKGAYVA